MKNKGCKVAWEGEKGTFGKIWREKNKYDQNIQWEILRELINKSLKTFTDKGNLNF